MRFNFHPHVRSWTDEDLSAAAEELAASFPRLAVNLRRAIVSFAAEEMKPSQGRERLLERVTHYARQCPHTIGMEAALSS